jgi:hypothetical protein
MVYFREDRVRFQVLIVAGWKVTAFWDIVLYSLIDVDISEVYNASIIGTVSPESSFAIGFSY